MNTIRLKQLVSFAVAATLFFNGTLPAFAQVRDTGRIKPAKSKDKKAKRGTIEIKNDTGKECNDFHIAFKPDLPTIEKVRVNGKDPFPAGYRPRGTQAETGPPWADFGRQKGDQSVKADDTIVIEIAWTDEMPEIAYFAWTLDGAVQTALEGVAEQKPEIKGKDADAVRKAKADAEAKAKKEADAAAKKEAEDAEKAAKKEAKKDAQKNDVGIQKSMGGTLEGLIVSDAGTVRIILPDDLRAGDTISGTVVAQPNGSSAEERQKNADELNGMVIEMGGSKSAVRDRKFTWVVPTAATAITYLLFRPDGTPLRARGPIELPKPGPSPDPVGSGCSVPPAAQSGKPFSIAGRFDPSNPTGVAIGGMPANVLAESPRKAIVEMPRGLVGPQEISVTEGGREVGKGRISVIDIRLSAPKTTLMKGEKTTIRIEVSGLEAINFAGDRLEVYFDPAYIIVQNDSPSVIEFFGPGSEPFQGTIQPKPKPSIARSIKIMPRMLDRKGSISRELTFRAKESGPFSVSAYFCLEGDFDSISRPTSNKSKPPRI